MNPYYFIMGLARVNMFHGDLRKFQSRPKRKAEWYDSIQSMASRGRLKTDLQYSVCYVNDDKERPLHLWDVVVGAKDGERTMEFFVVNIPTPARMYTSLRLMFLDQMEYVLDGPMNVEAASSNRVDWSKESERHAVIMKLNVDDTQQLYSNLKANCEENSHEAKDGETFMMYMKRRAQRNGNVTSRTSTPASAIALEAIKGSGKRQRGSAGGKTKLGVLKDQKEKLLEIEKWGHDVDIDISPDSGENDILNILGEVEDFEEEKDMSKQMDEQNNRVHIPRALGDWISVKIDNVNKRVACNCEDYNFDGDCQHCCFFDVMYFGNYPQNEVQKAGDNWNNITKSVVEILRVNKDIMLV
jgi:hypothetical protein